MAAYIGRFAPSPTGPLHFGSLVAALASYCDAKSQQGQWLLRIEDLDTPRVVKDAASQIITTLEKFGFTWDGEIIFQSQRNEAYQAALEKLQQQDLIYPCTCSRKEIADSNATHGIEGAIYPKTCVTHALKKNVSTAYRLITRDVETLFVDQIQGEIKQNIARDIGDFILRRADHLFAYQLAVVVDDAAQGITHIVRGADLLHSTHRQIYLQTLLSLKQPQYAHLPVVCNADGEKLSKQTLALPIDATHANTSLMKALVFLNQQPPNDLSQETPEAILSWASRHWQRDNVPKTKAVKVHNS